jgi:hypothetical protein
VTTPPAPGPRLPGLLDRLEAARGLADPVPSADGWRLVLAENIGYLVDDERAGRPSPNWSDWSVSRPSASWPRRMRCCATP